MCFFKICFNELPFADKLIDYTFSLSKGLKIAHLNIQSLRNKIDHLNILLHDNNIDILCITETWLTNEIDDSEISIPGYSICRNDRDNLERGHGGIINYIINGINYIYYWNKVTVHHFKLCRRRCRRMRRRCQACINANDGHTRY